MSLEQVWLMACQVVGAVVIGGMFGHLVGWWQFGRKS